MDPGEVCTINLEGIAWSIPMETVAAKSAEERGFKVMFIILENTPPETYAVPFCNRPGQEYLGGSDGHVSERTAQHQPCHHHETSVDLCENSLSKPLWQVRF